MNIRGYLKNISKEHSGASNITLTNISKERYGCK